jgi:hypothetical protein
MSAVVQANSTYAQIEQIVRELTASSSESSLRSAYIQELTNTFLTQDFPNAIKTDQMRSVYTFYTEPYIDLYPLDINFNQGERVSLYVDGKPGYFFKDRTQFYNMWPRLPTSFDKSPTVSGGTTFSFTIPGPFLRNEVTLGGVDNTGAAFSIADDGNGNLQLIVPNAQVSVPVQTLTPPVPGMYNLNTNNPGLKTVTNIGSVNYVSGVFSLVIPTPLEDGTTLKVRVSQYNPGFPYCMLFWNNFFQIRPIPRHVHKVEIESYLTPVQFLQTTDVPIVNQWKQYIAYGVAREILRRRQDMEGVANLQEGFERQEALVLERQAIEEIGQRNTTIFSSTVPGPTWGNGYWGQGNY